MALRRLLPGGCMLLVAADPQAADIAFTEPNSSAVAASQRAEYQANVPKTVVELQSFRRSVSADFAVSGKAGAVTLIDLSPQINVWFLYTIHWNTGRTAAYHLENPWPEKQTLALSPKDPLRLELSVDGHTVTCVLGQDGEATTLQQARQLDLPYAPLCEDHLYLRNDVAGSYSHLERVTNFLRDHVWGGERIVGFVKNQFFRDAFIESGAAGSTLATLPASSALADGPRAPHLNPGYSAVAVVPTDLGIDVASGARALVLGQWYAARDADGISLSIIQPRAVNPPRVAGVKDSVNTLDPVEAAAIDYIVALDLAKFDLGFALGTDHPRVGWSARALETVRDPRLAGPDGIGVVSPLVVNGIVNPAIVDRVAAAFAGGFKREHGAFRFGSLAQQNHGTHYGFIEQGVVFSKLQPALATLLVMNDGSIQMKTWRTADDALLPQIKFARQNGVALIEYDEASATSAPGALVANWGAGNWSGSDDERLRTLRAGVCLQVTQHSRYLLFGYFSTATPSAMARVFQAYGCRYAMHLDMNALEHTYFAIYSLKDGRIGVQHLMQGMAEVDRKGGDELAPRFLGFPDDRDFFYLTRKKDVPR